MNNLDPKLAAVLAFMAAHFGHLTWAQVQPAYQWIRSEGGIGKILFSLLWNDPKPQPASTEAVKTETKP